MSLHLIMYAITIVMHAISIGIYLYVAYRAFRRPDLEAALKIALIGACSFAVMLSGLFMALQIDWMLHDRHHSVGINTSYLWLLFDYLLVIYMINIGQILNVIAQWSRSSGRRRSLLPHPLWPIKPRWL